MDKYKVVLPSSLSSPALDNCTTFCSHSSRLITFSGLSKDNCSGLSSLLNLISKDFRACSSPEIYLIRASSAILKKNTESDEQKVVLVGPSNLKYSARYFMVNDLTFVDNSTPGWTANPPNIARLTAVVEQRVKESAKAFVFDLLGNSSVRYEQFDGTTSLPYKSDGKFYLAGNVVISPENIFQKTVKSIVPIPGTVFDHATVTSLPVC